VKKDTAASAAGDESDAIARYHESRSRFFWREGEGEREREVFYFGEIKKMGEGESVRLLHVKIGGG
jgi:hypothetical protein